MNAKILASIALTAVCAVTSAQAAVFPLNVYNTGVDNSSAALPNGTLGDPHYTLISAPLGSSTDVRVLSSANGYPIGPWLGDNSSSRWIAPNNGQDLYNSPQGNYTYRTTFDLTGLVPFTASISGSWATDNNGVDILINGVSIGATTSYDQFALGPVAFSITSGFIAGINTIDFIVFNDFGPTGLRVEMTGTAADVPEPASLALLGIALAGVALTRRQRA